MAGLTDAQRRAINNYRIKHIKTYTFNFNREKDKDIIDFLENNENKSDLVKRAIRQYLYK